MPELPDTVACIRSVTMHSPVGEKPALDNDSVLWSQERRERVLLP